MVLKSLAIILPLCPRVTPLGKSSYNLASLHFSISFVILSGHKACNTLQLEFEIPKLNVSGWARWWCQRVPYFQRRLPGRGPGKVLAPGGGPYHVSSMPGTAQTVGRNSCQNSDLPSTPPSVIIAAK